MVFEEIFLTTELRLGVEPATGIVEIHVPALVEATELSSAEFLEDPTEYTGITYSGTFHHLLHPPRTLTSSAEMRFSDLL
jgi:hypothetical protein